MPSRNRPFHIITALVLTMFIISFAVTLALNFKFIYSMDIDRYDLDEVSGLTKEELMQDYDELIDYNCAWGDDRLDFPHFTLSEGAEQHFHEARVLFLFFAYGIPVFGILALVLILIAKKQDLGFLYLRIAGGISLALPAALGIFAASAWDKFFVLFHEISFGNDLWLFDPAVDPVINALPGEYFFHEAIAIFGLVILGGLSCIFTAMHTRSMR